MFVPNFEAMSHVTLVLGPEFGIKSGRIEKRLKSGKKYFTGLLYVSRYPFIPINPLLAR